MPPVGLAMVQLDLPGHGYSQGERAYIDSYTHWLDDYFQVGRMGGRWSERTSVAVCARGCLGACMRACIYIYTVHICIDICIDTAF